MSDRIFTSNSEPRIGIVVATGGAVPLVHLHLEGWKRHCPGIPLLLVCYQEAAAAGLQKLCEHYQPEFGAFESDDEQSGILAAMVKGFEWGELKSLDVLVVFSEAWIPVVNWKESLVAIAMQSQFATLSGGWMTEAPRFSAEVLAFHPPSWKRFGGLGLMREHAMLEVPVPLEEVIYEAANGIFEHRCSGNKEYCAAAGPSLVSFGPCGFWAVSPSGEEGDPRPSALSRNWADAHDYLRALRQWGLDTYTLPDLAAALKAEKDLPPPKP